MSRDYNSLLPLLEYKDNTLFWKQGVPKKSGKPAVGIVKRSDRPDEIMAYVSHKHKAYAASRLVALLHGWNLSEEDYTLPINKDHSDISISNIKIASRSSLFLANRISKGNSTGYKNVSFNKSSKLFMVKLRRKGLPIFEKGYTTLYEAAIVAREQQILRNGEFAYDGVSPEGLTAATPSLEACNLKEFQIRAESMPTTSEKVISKKVKSKKEPTLTMRVMKIQMNNLADQIMALQDQLAVVTTKLKDLLE